MQHDEKDKLMRAIALSVLVLSMMLFGSSESCHAKRVKGKSSSKPPVSSSSKPPVSVRIVDADYQQSLGSPDKGDQFVMKNVRFRMEDTRYVDGTMASNMTVRVRVADFDDPSLLEQIRSNCSTIGVHDATEKKAILQREACKLNVFGEFEYHLEKPFHIPKTFLTSERSGYLHTYYFVHVRLARPEEIDPPATPVTAQELKSNGRKYIGQWVSMSDAIVRSGHGRLKIEIGGENVVQVQGRMSRRGDEALIERIRKRCYDEIEYKDVYKPEECTFNVKFRVADVRKRDADLTNIFESGKKDDVLAEYFSFLN